MTDMEKNVSPVFRVQLDGEEITVRFSDTESDDVKGKVRDILTASYEERMQALLMEIGGN